MSTIYEVAKLAGVSPATVSNYINGNNVRNKNKSAIEEAIKKLNYKTNDYARSLRIQKSMTIGVMINEFKNSFASSIISEAARIFYKNGYGLIVSEYHDNETFEKKQFEKLIQKQVDGMIILPYHMEASVINTINVPVVFIDLMPNGSDGGFVLSDNENAAYEAVKHLIKMGHKKIGIVNGPTDLYTANERMAGYIKAHNEFGLNINSNYIKCGVYSKSNGYNFTKELLSLTDMPTAIFATNNSTTLGMISATIDMNKKIGEDISLLGFDADYFADIVNPKLTYVKQNIKDIGINAAQMLLNKIQNLSEPKTIKLKTELIINSSVKNLNK